MASLTMWVALSILGKVAVVMQSMLHMRDAITMVTRTRTMTIVRMLYVSLPLSAKESLIFSGLLCFLSLTSSLRIMIVEYTNAIQSVLSSSSSTMNESV